MHFNRRYDVLVVPKTHKENIKLEGQSGDASPTMNSCFRSRCCVHPLRAWYGGGAVTPNAGTLRLLVYRPNTRKAVAVVMRSTFSTGKPYVSASFSSTCFT